jgi:sigma-E factor negative regulatory protein RseA
MPDDQKQNQVYESVSALVDNQASPLELQRILAHTEKHTGVRARWHRYHLARAVLRGESKGLSFADISDKVRAAIADLDISTAEQNQSHHNANAAPTENSPVVNAKQISNWFRFAPVGRVAIAASVALAAVLGVQQFVLLNSDSTMSDSDIAQTNSAYQRADLSNSANLSRLNVQNVSSASFSTPVDASRQSAYDFQTQRRQQWEEEQVRQAIHRLMLEHAQQAALDQSAGLMPFIRVSDSAIASEASQ